MGKIKKDLWNSLKWSFIIETILTAIFLFSALLLSIHSELFELLSLSVYPGIITVKTYFPSLYKMPFLLMLSSAYIVQFIYTWLLLFMLFTIWGRIRDKE